MRFQSEAARRPETRDPCVLHLFVRDRFAKTACRPLCQPVATGRQELGVRMVPHFSESRRSELQAKLRFPSPPINRFSSVHLISHQSSVIVIQPALRPA